MTTQKLDLNAIKDSMTFSLEELTVTWSGNEITLSQPLLVEIIRLGIYRQASQETAKDGYTVEFEKEFIDRLRAGYLTKTAFKRATQPALAATGGKAKLPQFGQLEIIAQARSMIKKTDKQGLETLDKIATYDSEKFGLLLKAVADKPDSVISRAMQELQKQAADKAAIELEKQLQGLDII